MIMAYLGDSCSSFCSRAVMTAFGAVVWVALIERTKTGEEGEKLTVSGDGVLGVTGVADMSVLELAGLQPERNHNHKTKIAVWWISSAFKTFLLICKHGWIDFLNPGVHSAIQPLEPGESRRV